MKRLTFRRASDILISALLILILLPLMAVIALTIVVIDQHSPLITGQGDLQYSFKFRTMSFRYPPGHIQHMIDSMDYSFMRKSIRDQRVTHLGAILRQLKLDGLPQLFTVLAGHLTIV